MSDHDTIAPAEINGSDASTPKKITLQPYGVMRDAALGYADKGIKVFPCYHVEADGHCSCRKVGCKHPGKHPDVTHGYLAASSDLNKVKRWWMSKPFANIGIACDSNNLAVLDADFRNGGHVSLAELEATHGPITSTVEAISGSGSRHIVFAFDGDAPVSLPGQAATGIDIKRRGYIVAEPSNHTSGGTYRWAEGKALGDALPMPLPAWVLELKPAERRMKAGSGDDTALDARREAALVELAKGGPTPEELEEAETMRAAVAETSVVFTTLWDTGITKTLKDTTGSGRRASLASRMQNHHGGEVYTARHHRALCLQWDFHVGNSDPDDRQYAREWAFAYQPSKPQGDGGGPGVADDEPEPDRFADARAALACEHQFGTPATIRAAHDALVVAAYATSKADLAKSLDAMTAADKATDGAAEKLVEAKPEKSKKKKGIVLPVSTPILDLDEIPATDWLVYPMYARRVVGTIIGPAGVAKSRLALTEVLAVVAGRPEIAGWPAGSIIRRVSAWYHCQEDDLPQIQLRLAALRKQYGVPKNAVDGSEGFALHLTSGTNSPLTLAWRNPETKAAMVNPDLGDIVAFIKESRIGLLAVDPATELHELDENNAGDMRVVWGAARTIAEKTFAHVLVISHSRKPDGASNDGHAGDMNTLRGSSAAVGVVRCARTVFTMSEKDAERFKVDPARRNDFLRLDDAKNNLAPMRYGPQWFERTSVDRDGLDRNRVGVVLPADLTAKTAAEVRDEAVALRERVVDVLRGKIGSGQAVTLPTVLAAAPDLAEAVGEDASNRSRWFKRDVMGGATGREIGGGKLTFKVQTGKPMLVTWTAESDRSDAFGAADEADEVP